MVLLQENLIIPFVDLKAQYQTIKNEIDDAIAFITHNTDFIQGSSVSQFESNFAQFCGTTKDKQVNTMFCASCANGTDALEIALTVLGVGPGDEVLVPSHTFFATIEAVVAVGAKPVFVDVDPKTMLLDSSQLKGKLTPKTKAIIAVHLYGQPCDMDTISTFAKTHQLKLIEDAAQAHGAFWGNHRVGSFGDLACFSFFPGKNLGCYGDGGAIVGSDQELVNKAKQVACHGREKGEKFSHDFFGRNSRLDNLQAAILNVKLKYIDKWNDLRQQHAENYNSLLNGTNLLLPYVHPNASSVWHLYVVRATSMDKRNGLKDFLKNKGISSGLHYPIPVHLQPAYQKKFGPCPQTLPETEKIAHTLLSLPIYPELNNKMINLIVEAIKQYENT